MGTTRPYRFWPRAEQGRQGSGRMSVMIARSRAARLPQHFSISLPIGRWLIPTDILRGGAAHCRLTRTAATTISIALVATLRRCIALSAGAMRDASSLNWQTLRAMFARANPPTRSRLSRSKRWLASIRSSTLSAASMECPSTSDWQRGGRLRVRSSRNCTTGSQRSAHKCPGTIPWPRRSTTCSRRKVGGMPLPGSWTTAGFALPTMPPNGLCGVSPDLSHCALLL
jgi:hypothetical protein